MFNLQVQQLNQLKAIFDRFDMDSDGSLTMLELAALLVTLGLKPSGDQVRALFARADSNGNGKVEFEELVSVVFANINEQVLANQKEVLELFKFFDRDGNGVITLAELAGALVKLKHRVDFPELTGMMRGADTNDDGVISFPEFVSAMARSASDFLGIPLR